jgi:hypothetical protein
LSLNPSDLDYFPEAQLAVDARKCNPANAVLQTRSLLNDA